jgi:hypothetical protein
VVALRHSGGWSGPDRLTIAGEEHRVMPCVSDLQIREALGELETVGAPGVLLCDLSPAQVGEDVLARLVKRRVHHPQMGEMLRELFNAKLVDARVLSCRPLVDSLVKAVAGGPFAPAPGGTLDLQYAWKTLLRTTLGFEVVDVTFSELLRWATIPAARAALSALSSDVRREFANWLAPTNSNAPRQLLHALDSQISGELVSLGLLMGMISAAERAGVNEALAGLARLEQFIGHENAGVADRQTWYQAATEVYRKLVDSELFQAQAIIQSLDRLIERVRLQDHAHYSEYSRVGLEQRIGVAGRVIKEAIGEKSDSALQAGRQAIARVAAHRLSIDDNLRLRRLQMAIRLVTWVARHKIPEANATLSQLCAYYASEGGFVDWARNTVVESDPNPETRQALHSVLQAVDASWESFQKQFAERVQQWSLHDSKLDKVLRIEEVLWATVAPVAKQAPALLIVLDGMSQAVFRELLTDLLRRNWLEVAAPAPETPRSALAAIPSTTEVSRRALIAGQLPLPSRGTETTDFTRNDRLHGLVGGAVRPQLFLKGDLAAVGRPGLAPSVAEAIANDKCRLVGAVVNVVDDTLSGADQASYTWNLDQIGPLHEMMRLASECGRVVILASDHGHVLDAGSKLVSQPLKETGDRFRLPAGNLSQGEWELRGPRITAATGVDCIVALGAQRLRYQGKRRGYHGGICPQELLVPCVVLRSSNCEVPDSWDDLPPYEPEWWTPRQTAAALPPTRTLLPAPTKAASKQPELFPSGPANDTWIADLIASPTYAEQTKATVRGAPPADQLTKFLVLLEQRNGTILRSHLAQQMGMATLRVDGLIQNYRRLLNVDSYDVLSYDPGSETVTLNIELLKSQFQI